MLRYDIEEWKKFYNNPSFEKEVNGIGDPDDKKKVSQFYSQYHVGTFLRRSTWWFSRLMRSQDNDIFDQSDFDVFGLIHLAGEEETLTWSLLEQFENESFSKNVEVINEYVQD